MSTKSHFMPWASQDYLTCRVRMRSAMTGDHMLRTVYFEALNGLHENGGTLPADPQVLADKLLLPADEIARCLPILDAIGRAPGRGGLVVEEGVIRNRRVSDDLQAQNAYREHQSEVGRIGGKKAGKGRPVPKPPQTPDRGTPINDEGNPKPSVPLSVPTPSPETEDDDGAGGRDPEPPPTSATPEEAGKVAKAHLGSPPVREGPEAPLDEARCPDCHAQGCLRRAADGDGWFCGTRLGGCNAHFRLDDPAILVQLSAHVRASIEARVTRSPRPIAQAPPGRRQTAAEQTVAAVQEIAAEEAARRRE